VYRNLAERYEMFQRTAVNAIVEDFRSNSTGRYLLVIPTGGGKTITAAKAIRQLFQEGILDAASDRVLWVAHREELLSQAQTAFLMLDSRLAGSTPLTPNIVFSMLAASRRALASSPDIKLIVIDEAHHGAAASYQPLFENGDVGILGLTATPTRHDGKALEFERESFSIGFPDLVNVGVILRPTIHTIAGGHFNISDIGDYEELEQLNNASRNSRIIAALASNWETFQKVVIFVGTTKHAEDLCRLLRGSTVSDYYPDINFIVGNRNSRGLDRKSFLDKERELTRSILVNVQVLSEGYDDPKINTVVMAAPTKSKLVYMQAIGRAIRLDPANENKLAHIVEVVDELPNVKYRIDNRWLYSDISDVLEPAVVDVEYHDDSDLLRKIDSIFSDYSVEDEFRPLLPATVSGRYGLLLFKYYKRGGSYSHLPLLIDNSNRLAVSNFFNFLSARMSRYVAKGVHSVQALEIAGLHRIPSRPSPAACQLIIDAMSNCVRAGEAAAMPWISFVSFTQAAPVGRPVPGLDDFLSDVVNKEPLVKQIFGTNLVAGSALLKLPLPLGGSVGVIVTSAELRDVQLIVNALKALLATNPVYDHRDDVNEILRGARSRLAIRDVESLPLIVRNNIEYFFSLA